MDRKQKNETALAGRDRSGASRSALLLVLALAGWAIFAPQKATAADEKYEVTVERNLAAKMRDGVMLRADIYRPKAEGKFPVLLVRTPYDKMGSMGFGLKAAARGYVVIAQDVRGRFESEGEVYPFKNESQDGYDTVEWAAALPYSNGKVGMFGGSYVGATQFLAAIARPPHLAGICPTVTASNYHDGWTYQGGAFEQWFNESWSTGLATNTMRRRTEKKADALGGTVVLPLRYRCPAEIPHPQTLARAMATASARIAAAFELTGTAADIEWQSLAEYLEHLGRDPNWRRSPSILDQLRGWKIPPGRPRR